MVAPIDTRIRQDGNAIACIYYSTAHLSRGATSSSRVQSEGIDQAYRVSTYVGIGVYPAPEPDRITLDVPTDARIVVAEPVLVQAVLDVEVLPGEAQIGQRREGLLFGLAEGAQHGVPGEVLRRVGRLLRRVEMVGVDEVEVAAGDERQRHVAEPEIFGLSRAGRAVAFGEEMAEAVVEEMCDGR